MRPWKIEAYHQPLSVFKSFKTAHVILKGIEAIRALQKDQTDHFYYDHPLGKERLVNRVFGL